MTKLLAAALTLSLFALGSQALAGEHKKEEGAEKADGQYVAVSPFALPMVADGAVMNYVFVTARIELTPQANAVKMREKEPYFRDAAVRAGHRAPFNKPGDLNHVDEAKLIAQMTRDANAICGPGMVKEVKIVVQQPKTWIASKRS